MKKGILALFISISSLIAIILLAAVLVSPLSRRYIVKHSKELTGRQINIDRLRINIFSGSLRVSGFAIAEADDSTQFASLGELRVRMSLPQLLSRKVIIKSISLDSLCVNIVQSGEKFNFSDIVERFRSDTASVEDTVSTAAWDLGLYDISIDNSTIEYRDRLLGAEFGFRDLSLYIPGVYFSGKSTDVGLNLHLTDGGSIGMNLKYDMEKGAYNIGVKVRRLKIGDFLPYVRQSFDIGRIDGRAGMDMNIDGNLNHILQLTADGALFASGIDIEDRDSELLLSADSLYVGIDKINLAERSVDISEIRADKIATRLVLNPDGSNNFTYLLSDAEPAEQTEEQKQKQEQEQEQEPDEHTSQIKLHVADFELTGGSVLFSDRMNVDGFDYRLRDINVRCKDFAPDKSNVVTLSSRLNNKGMVRLRWAGAMNNLDDQNLTVVLSNVDIKDFTPYSLKYLAYPLTGGTLSFKSQNVIASRHLNGTNSLDLYGCEAGKKRKDINAEYNIPLRAGIYVLKDKTGHINLDLPVSGSLDSPSFSYRKIILKTLANVFVKVATAPFDFLTGGGGQLDRIPIDPMQMMFSSEVYSKLDEVADIMRNKPGLSIGMEQRICLSDAVSALAVRHLKGDFYKYINPDKRQAPLELIDIAQIDAIDTKSEKFRLFADSLSDANMLPADKRKDCTTIADALYRTQAQSELMRSMEMRNQAVCAYMRRQHGIADSMLTVSIPEDDKLLRYKGKNMYKIEIKIAGETLGADSLSVPSAAADTISARPEVVLPDSVAQ